MKRLARILGSILGAATSLGLSATARAQAAQPETPSYVFFASPSIHERYYREKFEELIRFYEGFLAVAHADDHLVIVADAPTFARLMERIPPRHLMEGPVQDIWMRDFSPVYTRNGVFKMRYRPDYLSARDAHTIEDGFMRWFRTLGIPHETVDLVLDGGNFVGNGSGQAVVTRRILADNPDLSEDGIRALFRDRMGIPSLALIPEEPGDTTGHSDGMVKWLAPGKIAVNAFTDAKLKQAVTESLKRAFPEVEIVDLVWSPTNRRWRKFADASGVYVNAMTTPHAIYVPTFQLPTDARAVDTFRQHADREVIPVPVSQEISIMGGAVRCLSWQISGPPARGIDPPPETPRPAKDLRRKSQDPPGADRQNIV